MLTLALVNSVRGSNNPHYRDQAVSDLAWLMRAPLIHQGIDMQQWWQSDVEQQLALLDNDPAPLQHALAACKSHFLGSYFEVLFSYAVRHLSRLTILMEHEQIIHEGKTLGEVDMLVQAPDGKLHQFEIAIKFYLRTQTGVTEEWLGPNKNDSLTKKRQRALTHQLRILQTQAGQSALQRVADGSSIQSSLLIYGVLFECYSPASFSADYNHLQSVQGIWLRLNQLELLAQHYGCFHLLTKPHWLAYPTDYHQHYEDVVTVSQTLEKRFQEDNRPQLFLVWQKENKVKFPPRRVFVVPNDW